MAWEREDACVGCAECIGCGRKGQWWMQLYCDSCGAAINDGELGYRIDDGDLELCASCAAEQLFCDRVEEDRREYVRQCMATEGYDTFVLDDVIEWFDIPIEDQPDPISPCADMDIDEN